MTTQQIEGTTEYSLDGAGDIGEELVLDASPVEEPVDEVVDPAAEVGAETVAEPVVSDEEKRLRADNARLTREARQQQEATQAAQLQNTAAEYAQSRITFHISQGVDEATARTYGVLEARQQVDAYRAEQATLRATRIELTYQHGVPEEQLLNFQDEASMRHYAEQYANTTGPQAKELTELKARLATLEKGRVPTQEFNRPGGAGGQRVTSDNIDQLFVQFDNDHPGQANPYEARYRKFLNR